MSEQVVNTVDAARDEYFPEAPVLFVRIQEALDRIKNGGCPMRIPADRSDPDVVLGQCQREIEALRAQLATATLSRDHWKNRAEGSEANLYLIRQVSGGYGEAIRNQLASTAGPDTPSWAEAQA